MFLYLVALSCTVLSHIGGSYLLQHVSVAEHSTQVDSSRLGADTRICEGCSSDGESLVAHGTS